MRCTEVLFPAKTPGAFGEDAFKLLKGDNKELLIIPGANHVDLYDNLEVIPFDKIEQFMRTNLK